MRNLSTESFKALVEAGHETRNIEFKPAFEWDGPASSWLRDKVIRAVLGMSNTRDGGTIIVGIKEDSKGIPISEGVSEAQRATFERYDDIKGVIDGYGGGIEFDIAEAKHDGKQFVVITVGEFRLAPIICRKDGQEHSDGKRLLVRGEVYARAKSGTDSTIRATEVEMQEIIELAIDKGRRNLTERGWHSETSAQSEFSKQRDNF
jgi:predicted HTH transcriptional regulator